MPLLLVQFGAFGVTELSMLLRGWELSFTKPTVLFRRSVQLDVLIKLQCSLCFFFQISRILMISGVKWFCFDSLSLGHLIYTSCLDDHKYFPQNILLRRSLCNFFHINNSFFQSIYTTHICVIVSTELDETKVKMTS